jgi:predicted phage baseplate assembly protein
VTLPNIDLDDRRFQDLVAEARLRIARACPEWTEHNVSDPGITLIELFAWMTEMTVYRLNRVPDKLHMTLLELLGIKLDAPSAAETRVRFTVDDGRDTEVRIPAGTQVGTTPQLGREAVVFSTESDATVPLLRLRSAGTFHGNFFTEAFDGETWQDPEGQGVPLFGQTDDDALTLGFEESPAGLTLTLRIGVELGREAGLDPRDPPLVWEVYQGAGEWAAATVLGDTTGGLTFGSGTVELLAPGSAETRIMGERALFALRCRPTGSDGFEQPPRVRTLDVTATGVEVRAVHAGRYDDELLGVSDGTPGQQFPLAHRPVLRLEAGETLAVRDPESGQETLWEPRQSFEDSTETDTHFRLDAVSGTVELGPAIRHTDGGWTQYGAVPWKGAEMRFTRYRAGGGGVGNVAAGTLTALVDAVDGIAYVTNPGPASGGVDPGSLESARLRASMEIRTRSRAVTAEDFEYLATQASPRVARVLCIPPGPGEPGAVHLLPRAFPPDRRLAYDELVPDDSLLQEVAEYLDELRLIGTVVELRPCRFHGLTVVANVQAAPLNDPARVAADVEYALYRYLNPYVGGPRGNGWPFGHPLNVGVLYGIVAEVPGVEFTRIIRVYATALETGEQATQPVGSNVVLERDELVASGTHIVKATVGLA